MITILLATYNSEKYIEAQIDSLLNQTYCDWHLIIRDDLSSDNTPAILQKYVKQYPEKISILENQGVSKRAYLNFVELMKNVDSDYYMFCDHDDVWLSEKIQLSYERMMSLELDNPEKPIVVHTDMKVVDQNLNIIHESFWVYSRLLPQKSSFLDMVLCNSANGCTMLFNHKAKEVSMPNVPYATMHDMLVNQSVAANGGIISAINKPTVLYRQHSDNVVGASNRGPKYQLKKLKNIGKIIKQNYRDWNRSRHIKQYSILTYLCVKIKVMWWKIKLYSLNQEL